MKKHPLDIAILICLIIIIVLLVILIWPTGDDTNKKNSKKDTETKEVVEKEKSKEKNNSTDNTSSDDSSKTLFTDTAKAQNEEEVVSYISEVEQEVETLAQEQQNSKSVKEKLEDTFITLTDFIFYGGSIKGVTFQELTDSAKESVLTLYEKIDSTIESKFPNYKEDIKSTAKKSYTTVVSKASELKDTIISKYKEKVGEEAYNNVVDSFTEDKNRFQDAYTPYVEKGKEIGGQAIEKGKEAVGSAIDKLDSWYQGFKESRE